ncbi:hypothetical protein ACLOJK_025414 [Asimina triloba]
MECNKEEALRAKAIAEKKMHNKDFVGARKIALKAQQLFPELENISQMLSVCNVHCAAQMKVSGSEMDWYGILQIEQMADEASIKKQYRKLALLLHPDKNKFSGAEAAFKLIGEAHGVLADQAKRSLYDIKRRANIRTTSTRQPPPHMHKNSYPKRQNGVQNNFANHATSNGQTAATFWTHCPFCGIRYQYYRTIVNRALRCQSCQQTFIAYDTDVPGSFIGTNSGYTWSSSYQPNQVHNVWPRSTTGSASGMGFQGSVGTGTAAAESSKPGTNAEFSGRYQNKDMENGEMNKKSQAAKPSVNTNRKRGRKTVVEESEESSESCDSGSTTDIEDLEGEQNIEISSNCYPRRSTRQKQKVTYNEDKSDDDDYDDDFESPSSSKRAKNDGSSAQGNDQNNDSASKEDVSKARESTFAATVEDEIEAECDKSVPSKASLQNERVQSGKLEINGKKQMPAGDKLNFKSKDGSEANPAVELITPVAPRIFYPLPELSAFGKDRTGNKFAVDQIWAIYEDFEGMPRAYARIRKIISANFKLRITWLEACPDHKNQHLPYACGLFKLGRTDVVDDHSLFSHLASWEKGITRGTYSIYPKKGQIWAVYKGWTVKLSSNPDGHRKNDFEIVEVLSDYEDGIGVEVSYLVRLESCISLFQRGANNKKPFKISADEMLRFSHMIPHHKMTGNEGQGIREGTFELDPASLNRNVKESGSSIEEEIPDKDKSPEMRGETDMKYSLKNDYHNAKHGEADPSKHETGREDKHLDAGNGKDDDTAEHHSQSLDNEILYPPEEFHFFEKDKTADKFQPGQIWALYSDVDTLPKYYAQITKVKTAELEVAELEVHIVWLEQCSLSEGEMQWDNSELPTSCGTFKVTEETAVYSETTVFSHQVTAEPTSRKGSFKIYPRDKQIWAIYRDLKTDWTRADLKSCKHFIVEIKDSASMFKLAVLEKVAGYNSVFRLSRETREIRWEHLLEFSHQIPAHYLGGKRDPKLKGCFELDPAAVPIRAERRRRPILDLKTLFGNLSLHRRASNEVSASLTIEFLSVQRRSADCGIGVPLQAGGINKRITQV